MRILKLLDSNLESVHEPQSQCSLSLPNTFGDLERASSCFLSIHGSVFVKELLIGLS